MPRVGVPARFPLVAAYLVGALACWLAAAVALLLAAGDLARGFLDAPDLLLAVHLLGLGFLPFAVGGAALHVLPTLLRASGSDRLGWAAFVLLCAGPALAAGVARHLVAVVWPCVGLVAAGALLLAADAALLVARAGHGRLLLASRFGVGASTLHALLAFAAGPLLFAGTLDVPYARLVAIHLHLAAIGWLTLLILAVGRTLGPMLALAPAEPVRRRPGVELLLTAGLWLGLAGFWIASRPLVAAGGAVCVLALARFLAVVVRAVRRRRLEAMEGPIAHLAAGLAFLVQATGAGVFLLARDVAARALAAYVVFLLLGWAAGVTIGHAGKLLSLSAWTWWPPGPRPKQAAFYPRRVWVAEAAAFALGVEALALGVAVESEPLARAGAALLVVAAATALAGALATLQRARPGDGPPDVAAAD